MSRETGKEIPDKVAFFFECNIEDIKKVKPGETRRTTSAAQFRTKLLFPIGEKNVSKCILIGSKTNVDFFVLLFHDYKFFRTKWP